MDEIMGPESQVLLSHPYSVSHAVTICSHFSDPICPAATPSVGKLVPTFTFQTATCLIHSHHSLIMGTLEFKQWEYWSHLQANNDRRRLWKPDKGKFTLPIKLTLYTAYFYQKPTEQERALHWPRGLLSIPQYWKTGEFRELENLKDSERLAGHDQRRGHKIFVTSLACDASWFLAIPERS